MNNTDKLLRAFIEAQGFEIEEVKTTSSFYGTGYVNEDGSLKDGAIPAGTMESVDYKVTKKARPNNKRSAEERLSEAAARMGQHASRSQ